MRRLRARLGRGLQISSAFFQVGYRTAISYPLGFAMNQATAVVPAFIYFFVAKLVTSPSSDVGGDYYTFVIIGLVGVQMLNAGLQSFSQQIEVSVTRGWFEMILVEPVRWIFLPLGMAQWPVLLAFMRSGAITLISLLLGASYSAAGILPGIPILLLGIGVGLALGIIFAGVKVLAKSGDPILPLYSIAAQIFSGVYFPIEVLPGWLRPFSYLIPHTYVIAALRRVLMPAGGELPGMSPGEAIGILLAINVLLFPLALWAYSRAMEYGRKLGVLGGY